jgi:Flp pilus assembly protein TadG
MRNLVRGLARPVLRLLGRDDRGAYGVLITVLITGGVLLGFGALAVDVGQIYQNRAELQTGADAGALAVARTCGLGNCDTSVAATYAANNASALTGGKAAAVQVCGFSASGGLAPCLTGNSGTITDCPPNPTGNVNFVDVHTATLTPNGTLLPPVFARTLIGNQNYNGTRVFACAQAEWGPALQANSIAMVISFCAWNNATNGGQTFGSLYAVYLKSKGNSTCFGPAGSIPGGFDWLNPTSPSVCNALIDLTTSTSGSNTGNDVSQPCKTVLYNDITSYLNGTPVKVYIPVFDSLSGTGGNLVYHLVGMAGFVPTGYSDLSGSPGNGLPKAYGTNALCTLNDPCVEGYFTEVLDPVTTFGGGTNFGAVAAKLTG